MNDSMTKPGDTRRRGLMAATYVAIVCVTAVASSLHLAFSGSGFDVVGMTSNMGWGAGGYTAVIVALVLPFAAFVAPRGACDE